MNLEDILRRISIITGHYGSGKTNCTVNIAIALSQLGKEVTVVDLDLVNPYFRSTDFISLFKQHGIRIISPNFANSNLDIPSVSPEINAVITQQKGYLLFDVGGDDVGAYALGQFSEKLSQSDHDVYYLYNACRFLTQTPQEAADILREIERTSRMKVTKIINSTNLGDQTTEHLLLDSQAKASHLSKMTGIPLAFTLKADFLNCRLTGNVLPIQRYVKNPWD